MPNNFVSLIQVLYEFYVIIVKFFLHTVNDDIYLCCIYVIYYLFIKDNRIMRKRNKLSILMWQRIYVIFSNIKNEGYDTCNVYKRLQQEGKKNKTGESGEKWNSIWNKFP